MGIEDEEVPHLPWSIRHDDRLHTLEILCRQNNEQV